MAAFPLRRKLQIAFFACAAVVASGAAFAQAEPKLSLGQEANKDVAASAPAKPRLGALTTFADRTAFDTAFPGLPIEDFESGAVADGDLVACGAPLDASGDGVCFAPGDLQSGLVFQDVPGPAGDGLLLIGDGAFGNGTKILGTNSFIDSLEIAFPEPAEAVGFDVINLPGPADALMIDVFGPGDQLLGSVLAPSSAAGQFWGVSSPSPIARLLLTSTINEVEAVDNLAVSIGTFLVVDGVSSGDTCVPEPLNENGIWEPNEEIELTVDLRASGGNFTGITGTLSASDSAIVLLDAEAVWPDLAAGAIAVSDDPLRFVVAGDLCDQTVGLTLDVTSDQGSFVIPLFDRVGADQMPDVPQSIPDGALQGAESTLEISTDVVLDGLEVEVDIDHTWVGDVTLTLRSPSGTEVALLDRPGVPNDPVGCSNNGIRVTFSDAAAIDPEGVCQASSSDPWLTGSVLPAEALTAFDGESSQGTWTLIVRDDVTGDLGTLNLWRLVHGEPVGAECVACGAQGDLALTKTCTDFPTYLCTLEVTNFGPSTAFGVEVTDAIPDPLFWVADDCAAGPPVGDTLVWLVGGLNAGESAACVVDFGAPADMSGEVLNVATVTSQLPDPEAANNVASATLTLGTLIDVPTLGGWGLATLVLLLTGLSLRRLRRTTEIKP